MKKASIILTIIIVALSCNKKPENATKKLTFEGKLNQIKDSLDFGDFKVHNIYKNQAITYNNLKNEADSTKISTQIIDNLLKPYTAIFKNCWSYSEADFVDWNKDYITNDSIIKARIDFARTINLDSIIKVTYKSVSKLSGYQPTGAWYVYFYPDFKIKSNMSGCDLNTMQMNLAFPKLTQDYCLKILFPHEFNHNIYDLTNQNDPDNNTVLWDIINEGFATYFDKKHSSLSLKEAFDPYKDGDYEWCLEHEKEIFEKAKSLLFSTENKDYRDLGTARRNSFIENSPGKIGYFIGYRIIEEYLKKNGENAWRNIYTIPVRQLLVESGYDKYISEL